MDLVVNHMGGWRGLECNLPGDSSFRDGRRSALYRNPTSLPSSGKAPMIGVGPWICGILPCLLDGFRD